jgi:hypothetical protein
MAKNGKAQAQPFFYLYYGGNMKGKTDMTRITITLSDEEKAALRSLSEKEFREPRMQAALIIRKELERQRLVESTSSITESKSPIAYDTEKSAA